MSETPSIPESKLLPLVFGMAKKREAPHPAAELPDDPVTRTAAVRGWTVSTAGARWIIDAGEDRRILVERPKDGAGPLRFARVMTAPGSAESRVADLLRQNATLAHCGYASDQDGRIALVATLVEETADEEEVEAVLCSLVEGGERVATRPVTSFDPSTYKQAPPHGEQWETHVLSQAFAGTETAFQLSGAHAVIVLRLAGGRKQTVHVLFDRADPRGEQIVQMISVCGSASETDQLRKSLVSNASLSYATVALATLGGVENLVVLRTQLARAADREEILIGITTIGQIADRLEIELTGGKDIQ